jgi:glycosyltransferase involved in cell wall biosynthesis
MRASRRAGWIKDVFSLLYACQDQYFTRLGSWLARGWIVCNGGELGEVYKSSRTVVAVSSTVNEEDFFVREDTCQGEKCRILFVGFIRPEKGLQYLIEAVGKLKTKKLWELVIVGPWDKFPGYRTQLDNLIARLGIGDRISWEGYVPYGPQMFRYLRHCDLLVLPTLSEGAPHVLVEARANSLPLVSTTVGGIPTSVRTGHDGLLVPPKDPDALAAAIDRILEDRELRRSLIRNGLQSARALVMDRFLDVIVDALERSGRRRNPARTSSDRARTSS